MRPPMINNDENTRQPTNSLTNLPTYTDHKTADEHSPTSSHRPYLTTGASIGSSREQLAAANPHLHRRACPPAEDSS